MSVTWSNGDQGMMAINNNGRDVAPLIERFGVTIGTLVLIIAQTVAVVGWLVNDHAQILRLSEKDSELAQHITQVDNGGTRYGSQFVSRINQLEANNIANNRQEELLVKRIEDEAADIQNEKLAEGRLQSQIDLIKQELNRQLEQQMRIIQALDKTYDTIQEHLREHQGLKQKDKPLNLGPQEPVK